MTVSYDQFLPQVLPYVHDCPQIVAVNAIRNACIEFCDQSHWLVAELAAMSTVALTGNYALTLPANTQLARVTHGWFQDMPIFGKSQEELNDMFQLDWRSVEGRPNYFTHLNQDEIILVPKPTETLNNVLKLIVAVSPTRASTTCDDSLFDSWAEEIGFGARARLYETPGQPYSDVVQSVRFRKEFNNAISKAKIERNRGLTRGPMIARPPAFF